MDFPEDLTAVDPASAADLHPLEYLQRLAQSQPASVSPQVTPPSLPGKPDAGGDGWRGLLHMLAPVIGAVAMGGGPKQTGFLNGYSQGQMAVDEERRRRAFEDTKRSQIASDYMLKIADQAQQITDPVQFQKFADLADAAFVKAGFGKPGEIKDQLAFPANALAKKQLKELSDQIDGFDKGGYNLDDLASSGAVLTLSTGQHVPIQTAIQLTRQRPMDASGKPIAKPAKVAATEEERFITKWATENGLKVDALTTAQELAARKQFREAGRADKVDRTFAPGGVDSQYNDLVELWKTSNPGKEPPPAVRTKLRQQANMVNDKPPSGFAGAGGPAGNSALDQDGIDYAATEYRVTGKMPALGMGNGAARAAIINGAAKQARTLGQTPAAAIQKQAAFKADAGSLNKITSMSAAAESFENKALAQADIIEQLSAKVPRSQWPLINGAIVGGKINLLGDSNAKQLANAVETFSAEYAKIIEGSTGSAAGSSDSSRKASARLIDTSLNKGTMADVLNLMRREMRLTVQGYDATKAHITERMGGRTPDTPAAGGGASYKLVNGQWVKQ